MALNLRERKQHLHHFRRRWMLQIQFRPSWRLIAAECNPLDSGAYIGSANIPIYKRCRAQPTPHQSGSVCSLDPPKNNPSLQSIAFVNQAKYQPKNTQSVNRNQGGRIQLGLPLTAHCTQSVLASFFNNRFVLYLNFQTCACSQIQGRKSDTSDQEVESHWRTASKTIVSVE